jgi:hypothetical protein
LKTHIAVFYSPQLVPLAHVLSDVFLNNHNYGNCYTHIMSLNNVLKKKKTSLSNLLLTIKLEIGIPREIRICGMSLTNFITKCFIEYASPWMGFKLTT